MTSVSRGTMRDPDSSCHQPVSSENAFLKNLTGLALSDLGLNQRCFATSRYQTLRSYWSLTPCARLLVTAHWEGVSPGPRSSLSWKRAVTAGHPLPPILSLPLRGSTGSTQTVQDSRSRAFLLRVPTGSRGLGAQDGTTVSSGARRGQFRPGSEEPVFKCGGRGDGPNTALYRPPMALALRWLASFLLATSLPSQGDRTAAPPRLSLLQSPHRSVECPPEWPPIRRDSQRAPRPRRVAS